MNVLIPHSWLLDYIKTDAKPADIANALSLHAFSCEKIIKSEDGDSLFEIEITPNRGDALSVLGIARELKAVLPRQGFKAEWIEQRALKVSEGTTDKLEVVITDPTLVPRFSAVVLDNIKIAQSPTLTHQRLLKVGTRALNNVIDVTNYMMFDKGQPMHAFDYDKIGGHKMIVRESKAGEEVITLDSVKRVLPAGVIVIEDGDGRLIDLCGIMGAKNSEVDENTKKVLLFVQEYDPQRIRKASMSLGHRTEAALRFEKGIDTAGILPALWEAVEMLQQTAAARVSSPLIDIVNVSKPEKMVAFDYARINYVAGIEIDKKTAEQSLMDLGFVIRDGKVLVPSWRYDDIDIAEDLAEEVIRLYGYYKLPNTLLSTPIPLTSASPSFYWEDRIKDMLKNLGFFEIYTTSMTTKKLAGSDPVEIANPLNEDLTSLKTSLLPQLKEVMDKNQGYSDKIKLFELASTYHKVSGTLPAQPLRLALVTKGLDYLNVKGIVEAIYAEMRITGFSQVEIKDYGKNVYGVELPFEEMVLLAKNTGTYTPVTHFNAIKEDMTFEVKGTEYYADIILKIKSVDSRNEKIEFKDLYKNALTLSFEFLDRNKQITSEDTKTIRENIVGMLAKEFGITLKK